MAQKKKKKGGSKSPSKKRVGAVSAQGEYSLMLVGGALIGALGKRFGDTIMAKQTIVTDPAKIKTLKYVMDGVEVAGGAFLAYKAKHPFVKGIGVGFAIEGGVHGLQTMGVLAGMGDVDPSSLSFPMRRQLQGINNTGKNQLGNSSIVNKRNPSQQLGNPRSKMYGGGM